MAIAATIVREGNDGKGPIPSGSLGMERWKLVHDGAATSIVITAKRMRSVKLVVGTNATVAVSGKTATLTFAAAIADTTIQYVDVFGLGR